MWKFIISKNIISLLFAGFALIFPNFLQAKEDSDYILGRLENGLTYYINQIPESEKVNFYLVEKAGSINENDSQSGLAHFLEHMAFKGTKHFPDRRIVEFLQNNNVKFGYDLNAVTSFDKTVFRIENVSLESDLTDRCLLILRDWSLDMALNPEAVDSERKVIVQEAITTESLQKRLRQQLALQLLSEDNPYRTKTPIGDMDNIKTFPYSRLKDFYKRWYQPAFQAVIVEGNINPEEIEEKIKNLWNNIPGEIGKSVSNVEIPEFTSMPKAAIAIDPDIKANSIDLIFIQPKQEIELLPQQFYIENIKEEIVTSLLSRRLREKIMSGDSILIGGNAYLDGFTVENDIPALTVGASFRGNNWQKALKTLAYEIKRLQDFGVTEEEFDLIKDEWQGKLAYLKSNRDKKEKLSGQFQENFLKGSPIITSGIKLMSLETFLDTINISDLNYEFNKLIYPKGLNTVVIYRSGEKEDKNHPIAEDLISVALDGFNEITVPYQFQPYLQQSFGELMDELPEKGEIVLSFYDEETGLERFLLSNGVNVYFAKTESPLLRISAVSKKGYANVDKNDIPNFTFLNQLIKIGGWGDKNAREINQILNQKQINTFVSINPLNLIFDGKGSIENSETLFQQLFLTFTSPRKDSVGFQTWKTRIKDVLTQNSRNPFAEISEKINSKIYGNAGILINPGAIDLEQINYDRSVELFKKQFGNASDFDFIITGNIDFISLKEYLERFIASLPSKRGEEENLISLQPFKLNPYRDLIQIPSQDSGKSIMIYRTIMTERENNIKNRLALNIFCELLKDLYIKDIRDKAGSLYNINMEGDISRFPKDVLTINLNFTTNQDSSDIITQLLDEGVTKIAQGDVDVDYFTGIKNGLRKSFSEFKTSDEFIHNMMNEYLLYDSLESKNYFQILDDINASDIIEIAKEIENAPVKVDIVIK